MNRFDLSHRTKPSVLDRLLDDDPRMSHETAASRFKSLQQYKNSVRRDLEWLLNTRQIVGGIRSELEEAGHSLAAYGLPDFTSANIKSQADQTLVRRAVENVIRIFEPRLEDVVVTIVGREGIDLTLRFRIDARLKVLPAPEPVTFDTVLQLSTGKYSVHDS